MLRSTLAGTSTRGAGGAAASRSGPWQPTGELFSTSAFSTASASEHRFEPLQHVRPARLHALERPAAHRGVQIEACVRQVEPGPLSFWDQAPGDQRVQRARGESILEEPLRLDLQDLAGLLCL